MARRRTNAGRLRQGFTERYGAWALIAGASEGLGAAYARALAERGMNLVLVARRKALLDELAEDLRGTFGVEVRCCDGDLAAPGVSGDPAGRVLESRPRPRRLQRRARARSASSRPADVEDLMRVVDVNVRAPVALLRAFLPADDSARPGRGRPHDLSRRQPGHAEDRGLRGEQGVHPGARREPVVRAEGPGDRRGRLLRRGGPHARVRDGGRQGRPGDSRCRRRSSSRPFAPWAAGPW